MIGWTIPTIKQQNKSYFFFMGIAWLFVIEWVEEELLEESLSDFSISFGCCNSLSFYFISLMSQSQTLFICSRRNSKASRLLSTFSTCYEWYKPANSTEVGRPNRLCPCTAIELSTVSPLITKRLFAMINIKQNENDTEKSGGQTRRMKLYCEIEIRR